MSDFFEMVVIPISVSILVVCVLIGCLFGFVAFGERSACESYTQIDAQHNYQWTFWTGCLVQLDNGRWVDVNAYQQIQLEEGK